VIKMPDAKVRKLPPISASSPSPEQLLLGEDKKERLGPWLATAICGNDITSSCLYVSGTAILFAQFMAPVALLLVGLVLYLYRWIYTEVVEALPLDGGVYNCLLNSTRKFDASFAACLTLLSYMATAVISAKTAAAYLNAVLPVLPVMLVTAAIIVIFAILNLFGITDSARVALVIFILHLATLTVFIFWTNAVTSFADLWRHNWQLFQQQGNWPKALFFGFCAGLLGVSGFESSANYVEAQKPGVFRLTLRNMWLAVIVFNPLIALLALGIQPMPDLIAHQEDLLVFLGGVVGGDTMKTLIAIDACLVLSGAVLTSYVGVGGLVHRMTLDQCFPQFLLKSNRWHSFPLIVLGFMVLCLSILFLTRGDILLLEGVYVISFLGVMTAFAIGNMLLKLNRAELKRTYVAGWTTVILGAFATSVGLIGNIILDINYLYYFAVYFVPAVIGGIITYLRIPILRGFLKLIDRGLTRISSWRLHVEEKIEELYNVRAVVFVGWGALPRMIKAFDYLSRNEDCRNVLIFRFYTHEDPSADLNIHRNIQIIRELHPDLKIEYQARKGEFSPANVDALSKELEVPKNLMFMGALTHTLPFSLQDLGGVRIIW
jgi:amino acid transporter